MPRLFFLITISLLITTACNRPTPPSADEPATESAVEENTEEAAEAAEENNEAAEAAPFEGVENGKFRSDRFNLQFDLPSGWTPDADASDDTISITGSEDGLRIVVANTQSIQFVDTSFSQLNDRVAFDQVSMNPQASEGRLFNGLQGYRVEGDARLRGEDLPIYFVSQAVNVPGGDPVMITVFVNGDAFDLHAETIKAILDSVEAVQLRPN